MAYVPVPKDLTKVKTKVALNLTKRQLIFFSLAAVVGDSVLSVHEKTNRFQHCSHSYGDDHVTVFLHGNV